MAVDELSFGLYYDFRVLDPEPRALTTRWQGILDQVCWAETLGFGSVWVSEHHFLPDNYASSTLALLSALAVRTERMWLGTNVLVLPLHHPLRLAEDALTVDALSGGRLRQLRAASRPGSATRSSRISSRVLITSRCR